MTFEHSVKEDSEVDVNGVKYVTVIVVTEFNDNDKDLRFENEIPSIKGEEEETAKQYAEQFEREYKANTAAERANLPEETEE